MSAPMVRAILAGTKTQTRRAVKPVGRDGGFVLVEQESGAYWPYRSDDGETTFVTVRERGEECLHEIPMSCPYGQPGDRLWVRETWREWSDAAWHYAADGLVLPKQRDRELAEFLAQRAPFTWESYTWRPSIHMPRWASRITLEVTGVRVERLQDISEADAMAEGITYNEALQGWHTEEGRHFHCAAPIESYAALWEYINGPGSWDANPWVWCIEFRRLP